MIERWRIRRALQHQVGQLHKLVTRQLPLTVTPLLGLTIDADDVAIARRWLQNRTEWTCDDVVTAYHRAFAAWNGSRHAYAFMGGRVALSGCLHAIDPAPGDEIVVPGYSCVVVQNAVKYAGLKAVPCDIELDTYGLDVSSVEAAITPRTKAIVLQHLFGLVCRDYEQVLDLAQRRGIAVIEDCAHSTGAEYRGIKVGNRGTLGFYSSEQSKMFTTVQGGMAVTNDDRIAARLEEYWRRAPRPSDTFIEDLLFNVPFQYYTLKHWGRLVTADMADVLYGHHVLESTSLEENAGRKPATYGARMPSAVAALGVNQLRKIDAYIERRRQTARTWDAWCDAHGYKRATVVEGSSPVYLRYPVLVEPQLKEDREWARQELGIDLGVWFLGTNHPVPGVPENCPRAAEAVARCVNFPSLLS